MWGYPKTQNRKKTEAGNLLHAFSYRGQISYTPSVERKVGWITCTTLPFCSKTRVLFQLRHDHVRKDTRLSMYILCSGKPGNKAMFVTRYSLWELHTQILSWDRLDTLLWVVCHEGMAHSRAIGPLADCCTHGKIPSSEVDNSWQMDVYELI